MTRPAPPARFPPWLVDVGLPVAVAVAGVLPSGHEPRWAYPLAFVAGAALVLRRRYPRLVVLATFPALLGQLGTIAAGAALYALGRARPGYRPLVPWVAATMAVTLLPVAYEDIRYGDGPATWADWVVTVLVTLLITGGPAAAGALASTRRELVASVDALRAAEADRDDAVAARVRADERSRIARDVHDIVGHYASLIAVQASALESSAPDEQTRRTARTVRELSSRALDEMRSAVTTWLDRPDGEPANGNWTRWVLQPAVAAGESGVPVTVEVAEVLPAEVDEPALRALQRVVQEGITNAIRHAPGADVHVRLDTDGELVRIEVYNAAPGAGPPTKGGRGLEGLVDRIGALGGTVDAGPDLFGKWVLRASVPPGRRTPGGGYVR